MVTNLKMGANGGLKILRIATKTRQVPRTVITNLLSTKIWHLVQLNQPGNGLIRKYSEMLNTTNLAASGLTMKQMKS